MDQSQILQRRTDHEIVPHRAPLPPRAKAPAHEEVTVQWVREGGLVDLTGLRLGDVLVAQGCISRTEVEEALRDSSNSGGRLGDVLRSHGTLSERAVAAALAEQMGFATVDLLADPPMPALFCPRDFDHYIAHQFIPYRRGGDGVLTIATCEPSGALARFAHAHYGARVRMIITTRRELAAYFAQFGGTTATRHARVGLRRNHRQLVADRIMLPHQLRGLGSLMLGIIVLAFAAPSTAWMALLIACNCFYATTLILKFIFYREGCAAQRALQVLDDDLARRVPLMDAAALPIYSILVPMFREQSAVLARLMANLNALDYPKEKLDIKLICEADDGDTIAALLALRPPAHMEILRVPPSLPRTKPKACNIAARHIRGEFVVIYDAEDAPATDQLKRAVLMFTDGDEKLACLQAPLNYKNRDENTLTQHFSIEYSALFRLLLPSLARMGMPMPLGGTSNHLRTRALRDVGYWDAFNVTEDADLGVRLHYFGYTTRMLPSLTLEEAPLTLGAWLKQRTRWIKGYLQTWLVFTRDAGELKRRLGRVGYYGFQFFVGAPAITFLLAPIFWLSCAVSMAGVFGAPPPILVQILCAFSFVGGILSHWLFARKVMEIEGWEYMRRAFFIYPFYWLLHSVAAARALWQLVTAPHYWDKTAHGASKRM